MPTEIAQRIFAYASHESRSVKPRLSPNDDKNQREYREAKRFKTACALVLVDHATSHEMVHVLKTMKGFLFGNFCEAGSLEIKATMANHNAKPRRLIGGWRRANSIAEANREMWHARAERKTLEEEYSRIARMHSMLVNRIERGSH